MYTLQRMRYITAQYTDLRGLAKIPVGLFLIIIMLEPWMVTLGPLLSTLHVLVVLGSIWAILRLPERIRTYYDTTFGRVVPLSEPEQPGGLAGLGHVRVWGIPIVGFVAAIVFGILLVYPEWVS